MNYSEEAIRIQREYERRRKEIPSDYYSNQQPGNQFMNFTRWRNAERILKNFGQLPLAGKKILEVGCGRGDWLNKFKKRGADERLCAGIDLDSKRLDQGKERLPLADLRIGEAAKLPWEKEAFDLVLQSTVFTSILDNTYKKEMAREMLRVLRPAGVILWYDFFYDNPKNPNVKGVGRREIKGLFPGCRIQLERTTLAPPITRWLAPKSWGLCIFLEKIKIFNTHYFAVIQPEDKK